MRILIVDDEAPARSRLKSLLAELGDHELVGEAVNGADAIRLIADTAPEVVLLDIRMPGMDGLECARHLNQLEIPPAVIFTTAFDQFAVQAFESRAIDYLMKPIRREKLAAALEHARKPNAAQRSSLDALGRATGSRRHICARVRDRLQLVAIESVYYFRADQKYVTVKFRDGEVLIEESLKSLEQEFADQFMRIHRNALVANWAIESLDKDVQGRFFIHVRECGDRLEVSRRLVPDVRHVIRHPA